jgi:acetyl esterase/lipase
MVVVTSRVRSIVIGHWPRRSVECAELARSLWDTGLHPSIRFQQRSRTHWPAIASCCRAASSRATSRGGDSAGGGLTVALMISARHAGLPQPACSWCVSPWVDLECLGESMTRKADVDPLIQKPYLRELAAAYLNGADPRTPLAAPIYASLKGLAPLLIQVGSAETLLDDAVRLANVAANADVAVTLEVWPDMIHAWPLFHQQVTAGRHAIARAAAFIRSKMS